MENNYCFQIKYVFNVMEVEENLRKTSKRLLILLLIELYIYFNVLQKIIRLFQVVPTITVIENN